MCAGMGRTANPALILAGLHDSVYRNDVGQDQPAGVAGMLMLLVSMAGLAYEVTLVCCEVPPERWTGF